MIFGDDIELNKGPPEVDSLKKRKLSGECSDPHNSKKVCLSNSEDPFKDDFVIDTQDLEMAEQMAFEKDKTIPLPVSWQVICGLTIWGSIIIFEFITTTTKKYLTENSYALKCSQNIFINFTIHLAFGTKIKPPLIENKKLSF